MKVEIKTNEKGFCDYFIIDGKEYGSSIYSLDVHVEADKEVQITINAKSDKFIMSSDNTKLYLKKKEK
jgi:hypothetical protein